MSEADVAAVLAVQEPGAVLGLADVFRQDVHPFPREEVAARWRQELADPAIECAVVEAGGAVAGFAAVRGAELLHFGIAVEHWGSGLSVAAHDAVLGCLAASGVARAWLRVFEGNGRGRRFYERLGWMESGERTRSGYPPHPVLLRYERELTSAG
jgi:RimJ/RimL family protein N-acetyltransferase